MEGVSVLVSPVEPAACVDQTVTHQVLNASKDVAMAESNGVPSTGVAPTTVAPPKATFKEKVLGKFVPKDFYKEDEFGHITDNDGLIEVSTKDAWPCLRTTEKLRESLNRRWQNCLIVKLLGRSIGLKTLDEKIKKLWMPREEIELIELSEGHFLVPFKDTNDLTFALEEGRKR